MDLIATLQRQARRRLGLEVRRYAPEASFAAAMATACRAFDIDLVFDVGASIGQFSSDLRAAGYAGRIVSFEPLPQPWATLSRIAARDGRWQVHSRCALGDRDGETTIHVAANSVSSSVLPMLDAHVQAAPESAYQGGLTVPIHRFDDVAAAYLAGARAPLLKVDTQGFEWQVLDGAIASLPGLAMVSLELSVIELYEGQRLWRELIDRLERSGFDLWSLHPGFADGRTGRILQYDGIFRRRPGA